MAQTWRHFWLVQDLLNSGIMSRKRIVGGLLVIASLLGCSGSVPHPGSGVAGQGGTAGLGSSGGTDARAGEGGTAGYGGDAGQAGNASEGGTAGYGGDAGQAGNAGAAGRSGGTGPFGLNDVSMLFPLPEASGDELYRAGDVGAFGELLPQSMLETIGPIARVSCDSVGRVGCEKDEAVAATWPRLRVVGVRIDPCFPVLTASTCRHQVRFVWQPVHKQSFDDAAVHVFYDLPADDFTTVVTELAALSKGFAKDLPLQVHPVLAREGTAGPFATALKKALFARVGKTRVSRVTAMRLSINAGGWEFHGFDFSSAGEAKPIEFLGTHETKQTISGFAGIAGGPPTPVFKEDAPFSLLWERDQAKTARRLQLSAAYEAALAIENPRLNSVEEDSCVSCHTTLPVRRWAEETFGMSANGRTQTFVSSFDLSLTAIPEVIGSPTMFRAFGYRGSDVGISQRTVNESAAVAEFLNGKN